MKEISKSELTMIADILDVIVNRLDRVACTMEDYKLASRISNEAYKLELAKKELEIIAEDC